MSENLHELQLSLHKNGIMSCLLGRETLAIEFGNYSLRFTANRFEKIESSFYMESQHISSLAELLWFSGTRIARLGKIDFGLSVEVCLSAVTLLKEFPPSRFDSLAICGREYKKHWIVSKGEMSLQEFSDSDELAALNSRYFGVVK